MSYERSEENSGVDVEPSVILVSYCALFTAHFCEILLGCIRLQSSHSLTFGVKEDSMLSCQIGGE